MRDEKYQNTLKTVYSQAMMPTDTKSRNSCRYLTCIATSPDDFFNLLEEIQSMYVTGELKDQKQQQPSSKKKPTSKKGGSGKSKIVRNIALDEAKVVIYFLLFPFFP